MRYAGLSHLGRIATRLAICFAPPYYGRCYLARLNPKGYIAPSAIIHHKSVHFGHNIFLGDRVVIYQDKDGGSVELGERVHIYGETFIQTGSGGTLKIGNNSHIHPRCQLSAYKSNICIGSGVMIAPNCAFIRTIMVLNPVNQSRHSRCIQKGILLWVMMHGWALV